MRPRDQIAFLRVISQAPSRSESNNNVDRNRRIAIFRVHQRQFGWGQKALPMVLEICEQNLTGEDHAVEQT
jgi:hypothetical protein